VPDVGGRTIEGGRLGVTARGAALVLSVVLALVLDGPKLGVALVLTWGLGAVIHSSAFRVLARPALWSLLVLLVLPTLVIGTPRDLALPFGLAVSTEAVRLAAAMAARSLIIVVAAAGFASRVSVRALTELLEVVGLRGLGFSLGVAVHALPLATRTWTTSARALRLRGGFRQARMRDVTLLSMTVIGNALRHADEVVEAAQARGFDPARRSGGGPDRWRSDLAWIAAWALVVATLLLA
jgi:energy-coupling factor transporter transmembrane protein EcfT